jgi:hypothetical protein
MTAKKKAKKKHAAKKKSAGGLAAKVTKLSTRVTHIEGFLAKASRA